MCQDVCIVQLEHMLENGKALVLIVHAVTTRIVTDKAAVSHVQVAHTHVKKALNRLTNVFQCAATVHSHQQDWFHVWNVHKIHSHQNHQLADSRIVKLVLKIPSHSNQQLQRKIDADRNVHQVSMHQLDWHHAHHAHTISIKMWLVQQLVMNAPQI